MILMKEWFIKAAQIGCIIHFFEGGREGEREGGVEGGRGD